MISLPVCTVLAMALAAAQAHSEALYPRACPATPDPGSFSTAIPKLPDPFHFLNGQAVTTTGEWTCRQAEISTLLQKYELGVKPGAPDKLTASFSGNTLTITATVGSKSITFSPTITFPSSGTKPYPAIIGVGGASIPQPQGVAFINFNNNDLGAQDNTGSRGKGKFFDLYGPSGGAGATLAWAWGVSRILDALEATPGANIDPKRVGVTGCSRNGKGALIAGALDNRIALTIPQESGSGGTACWRLSDYMHNQGQDTQTASEIIGENVWFGTAFNTYASKSVNPLPFDHHLLAALVSPRPLFSIENTDYLWLGPYSSFGCMTATHEVYKALGKSDYHGFSQVGGHAHCSFPSKQQADLDAFVKRFLLGQNTNTAIFKTDGSGNFNFNPSDWINWTTPTLGSDGGGTTTPPTTTPPTTTPPTTTPPTTTTPPPTQPTQVKYGQCGGIGWTGPTVCTTGTTCQKLNDYYSQCL